MADEDPLRTGRRILLAMAGIGVGMALTAVLTGQWISATIVPELGAAEEEVVTSYTPLAFLAIAALGAPLVAGILGIVEGAKSDSTRHAAVIGVACLVGAVVMVTVAGVGVAFSEPTADSVDTGPGDGSDGASGGGEDDSSGSSPGPLELVGLAGLCGVGGLVSGGFTARFGGG